MDTKTREVGSRGFILVSIVLVGAVGLVLVAAVIAVCTGNSRVQADDERQTRATYAASAALHHGFAEIASGTDSTGNGLGALGIATPVPILTSSGSVSAEYRAVVQVDGGNQVLVAVAASPSFADPQAVSSARAIIGLQATPIFAPGPAAIAVTGPLANPTFPNLGEGTLLIDGGTQPAFNLTTQAAYDGVMDAIGDAMANRDLDGTEIRGARAVTYDHPTAGEITVPVSLTSTPFVTASVLNEYRVAMRAAVLDLAARADRVITRKVSSGTVTWGTAARPEVTVIEAGTIRPANVFSTGGSGVTVNGNGTLIIKHTVTPDKLTINWTGDVYVLGYDGDGSDLLYLHGTTGTITGNLVLLSSDRTEASFEMKDGASRRSNLTVNGNLLCLAEATSHEAEVEVEMSSTLTVNGVVGLYGSRMEVEASSRNSTLAINGTLAMGMAQDLDPSLTRSDDFEIENTGTVRIVYNRDLVAQAVQRILGLEERLNLDDQVQTTTFSYQMVGGGSGNDSASDTLSLINSLMAQNGTGGEYGVNLQSLQSGS